MLSFRRSIHAAARQNFHAPCLYLIVHMHTIALHTNKYEYSYGMVLRQTLYQVMVLCVYMNSFL